MQGFEIGGYAADFPIFTLLLRPRPHPETGALTHDGVHTADVDGKRCCCFFSDEDQAHAFVRDAKAVPGWGIYELVAADALAFFRWLPTKGIHHVTFDARIRVGDMESRTPIAVSDLVALLEGQPPEPH